MSEITSPLAVAKKSRFESKIDGGPFTSMLRSSRWIHALLLAAALSACSQEKPPQPGAVSLSDVRAAIVARNFSEAADLARRAVAQSPKDPAAQFELARAEALIGNTGRALDALDAAVAAGLPNAAKALEDPALDAIRNDERFSEIARRASPGSADPADGDPRGSGGDDVSIKNDSSGTHIKAGDVTLDTDF